LDLARIELAPVAEWSALFDQTEWPLRLAAGACSPAAILAAFSAGPLSDLLLDALQCAADLANAEGVEEIIAVADARRVSLAALGPPTNPLTFVLRLWRLHQHDKQLAVVLRLAQVSRHKRSAPGKNRREFAGQEALPYDKKAPARFRTVAERVLSERELGPLLELLTYDEGRVVNHVLVYAGREQEHLVATERGRERQRLRFVACDVVQYDPRDGRLTVCTRRPSLVDAYRRAAGLALFGDPKFFAGENLWSLDAVRADGPDRLLRHGMGSEISEVVPLDVVWRRDDGGRASFDGEHCFEMLSVHPWRTAGTLTQVSLMLTLWGAGRRQARVVIKPPNRLEVHPDRFRGVVDRYLRKTGLRRTSRRPLDLWGVSQGVHDAEDVVEALGADLERLTDDGLVSEAQRSTLRDGVDGRYRDLVEVDLPEGANLAALSDDEATIPELLEAKSGIGHVVELTSLADLLTDELELTSRPLPLSSPGLFDLGTRSVTAPTGVQVRVRVFLVAQAVLDESAARIELAHRTRDGSRPVLLVPHGRRPLHELDCVEWARWCPPFTGLWTAVLTALELRVEDPWSEADAGMELLIHRSRFELRLDGVDIKLGGLQGFLFALAVAEQRGGKPRSAKEIAVSITQNSEATRQAAAMARSRLLRAIDESLTRAGRPLAPARRGLLFKARQSGVGGWEIRVPFQILGGPRGG